MRLASKVSQAVSHALFLAHHAGNSVHALNGQSDLRSLARIQFSVLDIVVAQHFHELARQGSAVTFLRAAVACHASPGVTGTRVLAGSPAFDLQLVPRKPPGPLGSPIRG